MAAVIALTMQISFWQDSLQNRVLKFIELHSLCWLKQQLIITQVEYYICYIKAVWPVYHQNAHCKAFFGRKKYVRKF